jgi:hypothetical protein
MYLVGGGNHEVAKTIQLCGAWHKVIVNLESDLIRIRFPDRE